MREFNKIVGVGFSKTGTTTLAKCFEILGIAPHKSFDQNLKTQVENGHFETALEISQQYKSFEDSPWYLCFKEMDKRHPGSLFVLTTRRDTFSHAVSSWHHGVRAGRYKGEPTQEYLDAKARVYDDHNQSVRDYFKSRPDDLLEVCWEDGDGWPALCAFLETPIPDVPFPRTNAGGYSNASSKAVAAIKRSYVFQLLLKARYALIKNPRVRAFLSLFN